MPSICFSAASSQVIEGDVAESGKIQFPCDDYPIKVIASAHENLEASVLEIVQVHDECFDDRTVSFSHSRNGNYISVRLKIRATGEPQLKALHEELMAHPCVRLVL